MYSGYKSANVLSVDCRTELEHGAAVWLDRIGSSPGGYDPKTDPIVRVQARRLRSKLGEYYASEGSSDALIIQIPKGAYVPVFEPRAANAPPLRSGERTRRRAWLVL